MEIISVPFPDSPASSQKWNHSPYQGPINLLPLETTLVTYVLHMKKYFSWLRLYKNDFILNVAFGTVFFHSTLCFTGSSMLLPVGLVHIFVMLFNLAGIPQFIYSSLMKIRLSSFRFFIVAVVIIAIFS